MAKCRWDRQQSLYLGWGALHVIKSVIYESDSVYFYHWKNFEGQFNLHPNFFQMSWMPQGPLFLWNILDLKTDIRTHQTVYLNSPTWEPLQFWIMLSLHKPLKTLPLVIWDTYCDDVKGWNTDNFTHYQGMAFHLHKPSLCAKDCNR